MRRKSLPVRTSGLQKIALIVLGVVLSIVLIEIGMRFAGFALVARQKSENLRSMKHRSVYRILCLGESTTYRAYPSLLENILNQSNVKIPFKTLDEGRPGTVTNEIVSGVEAHLDRYHPQMVVAMMGVNDRPIQYLHDITLPRAGFFDQFRIYRFFRVLYACFSEKLGQGSFKRHPLTGTNVASSVPNSAPLSWQMQPGGSEDISPAPKGHAKDATAGGERGQGGQLRAKNSSVQALSGGPGNDSAYIRLGWHYFFMGDLARSNDFFKKALKIDPENSEAYNGLGRIFWHVGSLSEAAGLFEKAIELNPADDYSHVALGRIYKLQQKDLTRVEDLFRRAIELNAHNVAAYRFLGRLYVEQGKWSETEALFLVAKKRVPESESISVDLGRLYLHRGDYAQAEVLLQDALRINPRSAVALGPLTTLYESLGKQELAKEYGERLRALRPENSDPITARNFRKLKAILDQRGIKFVCVQYPMRSVKPLKKIFENEKGVVFVDNEDVFRRAVKADGYTEYFSDMFAGDFGHCTEKGNQLLAQNIADVILREVFHEK